MSTLVLVMPWETPPIRSNDRGHWRARAGKIAQVRRDACLVGRSVKVKHQFDRVTVRLVWQVTDRRIRDAGGPSPTLKAALDGLVDAGVLRADDSTVVVEERCRIEMGPRREVRLEITSETGEAA